VAWVADIYPWSRSYLDVYDHFGLLRERADYAHCIHLDATDRERMADTGTAMSFCATSNLFLGSGLFDLRPRMSCGVRVGLGTDVGGGTTLSMLRTMEESYKVCQLAGQSLSPMQAFYPRDPWRRGRALSRRPHRQLRHRQGSRLRGPRSGGDATSCPAHGAHHVTRRADCSRS
jgi:hypothetical protein